MKPDSEPRASTTASLTAAFVPATSMEAEVAAMLAAAGAGSGKQVEEAEDALAEQVHRCQTWPARTPDPRHSGRIGSGCVLS